MKTLPAELILEKNVWSQEDPWLLLIQFTLIDSTVLRYVANTENVTYDGNEYTAIAIKPTNVENAQQGALSEVNLTITNVGRVLIDYLDDPDNVIGSAVLLTFVHSANLTVDSSSLEVSYKIKNYRVNALDVEFGLGDDQLVIQRHPPRLYTTLQCEWAPHNFKGAECQYVGIETTCDGLLTTCRTRDSGSNTQHFGAAPCLNNDGLKVAIAK